MKAIVTKMVVEKVNIEETDTVGSNAYLVATKCGGVIENPSISYTDYQIIYADTDEEAVNKYNRLNQCSYYYGKVLKELSKSDINEGILYLVENEGKLL